MPVISAKALVSVFDSYSWMPRISEAVLTFMPLNVADALMNHSISAICWSLLRSTAETRYRSISLPHRPAEHRWGWTRSSLLHPRSPRRRRPPLLASIRHDVSRPLLPPLNPVAHHARWARYGYAKRNIAIP